jgi:predicted transcriptional regulator
MTIKLTNSQEEILHSVIDAYEIEEAEVIKASDVARRSGISETLAERILVQLESLNLVRRQSDGVIISADSNGYYP